MASIVPFDPNTPPPPPPKDPPRSLAVSSRPNPTLRHSGHADADWDIVGHDDLPLRWATDYVALASPGSRLANLPVQFFEFYRCPDRGRVTARLAIVTKQNILLYESVRGERAFRFVKVRKLDRSHDSITLTQRMG